MASLLRLQRVRLRLKKHQQKKLQLLKKQPAVLLKAAVLLLKKAAVRLKVAVLLLKKAVVLLKAAVQLRANAPFS